MREASVGSHRVDWKTGRLVACLFGLVLVCLLAAPQASAGTIFVVEGDDGSFSFTFTNPFSGAGENLTLGTFGQTISQSVDTSDHANISFGDSSCVGNLP